MSSFGLPPVRCHSCGNVVAHLILAYREHLVQYPSDTKRDALDAVGLTRLCCRARALGYAPDPATYETVPNTNVRGHVEFLIPTHQPIRHAHAI